ncbi:MAG: NAD(P)H-dependent oxidoreductase [Crenarchaeota archaeon]|nr:NAD(P)H-dependent oxidoreductase [Thermoproteota archaeon]MDW8033540.1 NAD(P)H-dependent oxidoreductase [Nitrososphaerota archaeon]
MKVLAINGSPRGKKGNTDRILQSFLQGAKDAGAQVETIYLRELRINPCLGCFTCWTRTPGVCIHNDDMVKVLPKIREADIVVYATPLYVFTVSGLMKNFMDRLIPNVDPHIVKRGEHFIHPPRYSDSSKVQKIVLISNCGFPEPHHFSALVETFKRFTDNPDMELVATILCAGGELLSQQVLSESLRWYLDAARRAGSELITHGRILPETQKILDTPLADPEAYANMANLWWNSQISRGEKTLIKEPLESISQPISIDISEEKPPESCREAILGMPRVFNPSAAGDLNADIQFYVTGSEPGEYVLRIRNGHCTAHEGRVSNPTLTIYTPSEVWLKISRGELSGQTAYLKNMYRVEGDFSLLLKLGNLFSRPEKAKSESLVKEPTPHGPIRLPGMAWLTISFLPWIINLATSSLSQTLSLGLSLFMGIIIWIYRRLFEKPTWMETGTLIYFITSWLMVLLGNNFFKTYSDALGYIAPAGIWLGTLAAESPLTAEYSKWHYPQALWSHPVFLRTNAIITTVWGWIYLSQAVLALTGEFYQEWTIF